jgi:hypothetical protein
MENNEVIITIAEFYAFNMKAQKTFINQSEEYVLADLEQMCKTNRLLSLTSYKATLLGEPKIFKVDEGVMESYLDNHPNLINKPSAQPLPVPSTEPKTESNEKNQP